MTPGLGQEHCVFFKEGKKLNPLSLLSLLIVFSVYCEVWLLLPRYNPAYYTAAMDSVKRKTEQRHCEVLSPSSRHSVSTARGPGEQECPAGRGHALIS